MQIIFNEDEREQIIIDSLEIRIKEGCPEALRKKIERKISILKDYERNRAG